VQNKAIFLDRDGTINNEVNYLTSKKDIDIIDGSIEALLKFRNSGFLNIVITNQSAVSRGLLTIEELEDIHNEFLNLVSHNNSSLIDDIFYSPYHIDGVIEKFKVLSNDRKPGTGLIEKAVIKHSIDLNSSFLIGDSYVDMKCAENAKIKKIIVMTGHGKSELIKCKKENIFIEYIAKNLLDASEYVLNYGKMKLC
jgi:D,D-heptose 1,7-bisphosphate phosphatase